MKRFVNFLMLVLVVAATVFTTVGCTSREERLVREAGREAERLMGEAAREAERMMDNM